MDESPLGALCDKRVALKCSSFVGCALTLLASIGCTVYDPSLLGAGTQSPGSGETAGQSGAAGVVGDGGSAGDALINGGSPNIDAGSSAGAGGSLETSGSGGTTAGTGGSAHLGGAAGAAGVGGTTGMGGSVNAGGTAGAGGIAGSGGTSGGGGASGSGGNGGGATANGCAVLSVPLDSATDKAHFVISLASPTDLSHATISMHLYVRAGAGGSIFNYVQDSGTYHFFAVVPAQRSTLSSFSGWSTVTWDVGAQPDSAATGIVKTSIKNIGIELGAQPSSSWTSPTIVYIDSITVTTPTLSFTFDASSSVYPTPTTTAATGQALWVNSGTVDTTAVGVSLGWQATCP